MATRKKNERRLAEAVLKPGETVDTLLKPREVAQRLNVELGWIYRQVENGSLPHLRIGKYLRFREGDLARWLAARQGA